LTNLIFAPLFMRGVTAYSRWKLGVCRLRKSCKNSQTVNRLFLRVSTKSVL